jgi:hypothetical protein
MHMDMTVTLGNVLTIATIVGGLFVAYGKIKERLVAIETQLPLMWRAIERRRGPRRDGDEDE